MIVISIIIAIYFTKVKILKILNVCNYKSVPSSTPCRFIMKHCYPHSWVCKSQEFNFAKLVQRKTKPL
jgi:hypothetical protein